MPKNFAQEGQRRIFFMNKERMKGIVIGFALCAALSIGAMVVGAQTVSKNITYGVGVILNGEQIRFNDDSRPFLMDGRTFLPLRTLAEILDLPVDFDSNTNNAILGSRTKVTDTRVPLNIVAPHFDGTGASIQNVAMGGREYSSATRYYHREHVHSGWRDGGPNIMSMFSTHNLDGQYRWLTGQIGRVDGATLSDATVTFYGDGTPLATYQLTAGDLPTDISIFVEGVRLLKAEIYIEHTAWSTWLSFEYALAAFLE
jgi:hypothetical protein